MDQIAIRAKVSKVTIYAHFGDKLNLFEACIGRTLISIEDASKGLLPQTSSLPETLNVIGRSLLGFLLSQQMVAFDRAFALEASRHPNLAALFLETGPYRCRRMLADVIASAGDREEIVVDDPLRGAEDLLGLWFGMLRIELTMARVPSPTTIEIADRVARGIDVFMRAYSPP